MPPFNWCAARSDEGVCGDELSKDQQDITGCPVVSYAAQPPTRLEAGTWSARADRSWTGEQRWPHPGWPICFILR
jgi:hypothetical protein